MIAIRFEISSFFFMNVSSDQAARRICHSVRWPTAIMQSVWKVAVSTGWNHAGLENSSRQCGGSSGTLSFGGGRVDESEEPSSRGRVRDDWAESWIPRTVVIVLARESQRLGTIIYCI